jgi:hypothetical protein
MYTGPDLSMRPLGRRPLAPKSNGPLPIYVNLGQTKKLKIIKLNCLVQSSCLFASVAARTRVHDTFDSLISSGSPPPWS